jgi:tripartite-type tricarboxylate transporter receptor subunit TctC
VLVVSPSFSATSVPELLAYAKANPGKLAMASNGKGTASHVIGELFQAMAGIELLHVPYRTSYVPDLLSGQVQVAFSPLAQSIGLIKSGKLRALAVTAPNRSDALPDVPAVGEFLPGYEAYVWNGIGAPKSTPTDIVDKLNKAINACLAHPTMKARLAELGSEPMPMTAGEFAHFISTETDKWAKVIRAANITAD